MRHRFTRVIIALLGAGLAVACGQAAGQPQAAAALVISASEYRFLPAQLTLPAGQAATLRLKNAGQQPHDLTLASGPGIPTPDAHADAAHAANSAYHVAAEPGQSATLTLTLPPGDYTFICSVPGHAELGMRGSISVR